MKRKIEAILDLKTDKIIESFELLDHGDKVKISDLKREIENHIQNKTKRFVCVICQQPMNLILSDGIIFHFKHVYKSDDCPLKTESISKSELFGIWYNGKKESERHKNLKNKIFEIICMDNRFSSQKLEGVVKSRENKKEWKKPDIQCLFNNHLIALEMQISHTFISDIVSRENFYLNNKIPIYWIFDNFTPDKKIRVFESDIVYYHNCNAFVFDDEAYRHSLSSSRLTFHIYWVEPFICENKIDYQWKDSLIDFQEIMYDENKGIVFYFDYEKKIKQYSFDDRKEEIFTLIRNSKIYDPGVYDKFKERIDYVSILFDLNKIDDRVDIQSLFIILQIFLSIKENIVHGYNYSNPVELLNIFFINTKLRNHHWMLNKFLQDPIYKHLRDSEANKKLNTKIYQLSITQSNKFNDYLKRFFPNLELENFPIIEDPF